MATDGRQVLKMTRVAISALARFKVINKVAVTEQEYTSPNYLFSIKRVIKLIALKRRSSIN